MNFNERFNQQGAAGILASMEFNVYITLCVILLYCVLAPQNAQSQEKAPPGAVSQGPCTLSPIVVGP